MTLGYTFNGLLSGLGDLTAYYVRGDVKWPKGRLQKDVRFVVHRKDVRPEQDPYQRSIWLLDYVEKPVLRSHASLVMLDPKRLDLTTAEVTSFKDSKTGAKVSFKSADLRAAVTATMPPSRLSGPPTKGGSYNVADDIFGPADDDVPLPTKGDLFRSSRKGHEFDAGGRRWRVVRDDIGFQQRMVMPTDAKVVRDANGRLTEEGPYWAEWKDGVLTISNIGKRVFKPMGKPLVKERFDGLGVPLTPKPGSRVRQSTLNVADEWVEKTMKSLIARGDLPNLGTGYSDAQRAESKINSIARNKLRYTLTTQERRFWNAVLDNVGHRAALRIPVEDAAHGRRVAALAEEFRQSAPYKDMVAEGFPELAERQLQKYVERRLRESPLSGLPSKGPIPASAVDYAMRKLHRQVARCGITKAQLREGMEVEREHRDVTRGGVEKTARIAAAHLCERKDYYKRLKQYVE